MSTKKIHYEGSVGIGTTNPENKLDVNGDTRLVNPGGRSLMIERDNQDSWATFHDPGNAWYSMGLDVSDGQKFKLNFGGTLGENNNHHFTMAKDGKIGIHTNNPAHALDVNGTINAKQVLVNGKTLQIGSEFNETDIKLQKAHKGNSKASWEQHILFADEVNRVSARITGKREAWDGAPMGLSFYTGAVGKVSEQMTIKSNGNIGIGVTDPKEKLEINGAIRVNSSAAFALAAGGDKGTNGAPADTYPLRLFESWGWNFTLQDNIESGFRVGPSSTTSNVGTTYFAIQAKTGNVGIGITKPAHKLDVNGTINAKQILVDGKPLTAGGGGSASVGRVEGDISVGHLWNSAATTKGVRIGKPDSNGGWSGGSAFIEFKDSKAAGVNKGTSFIVHSHEWGINTKEAFRVAGNGNVGIGIAKPAHTLDVNGTINAKQVLVNGQPLTAGGGGGTTVGTHGAVRASLIVTDKANSTFRVAHPQSGVVALGGNTDHILKFGGFSNDNSSFTERMVITPEGSVGIGIGAPKTGGLHVAHDLVLGSDKKNAKFIFHSRPGKGDFLQITFDSESGDWQWAQGITLKRSGNVGIGTSSPKHKLDVNGDAKIGSGARYLVLKNGKNSDATIVSPPGWLRITSAGDISFWTNGKGEADDSPQVRFDPSGNIHCQGSLAQNSDGRLKKAIQPIAKALDKVTGLRGVNYKWKDKQREEGLQMGLIAQEVESVLPEVVCTDSDGNKSITYSNLTAVLIEAIKELNNKVAKLESKATV